MDYEEYLRQFVRDFMRNHEEQVRADEDWILHDGHTRVTDDCDLWKTPEGIQLIERETSFLKVVGADPFYQSAWNMLYEDMNDAIVDVIEEGE